MAAELDLRVQEAEQSLTRAQEELGTKAALQVQNCSLPSTTLDLSDIKWGILDQEPIKRETTPVSADKQLTIQNIQ